MKGRRSSLAFCAALAVLCEVEVDVERWEGLLVGSEGAGRATLLLSDCLSLVVGLSSLASL